MAFSAPSLNLCKAAGSEDKSILFSDLNSSSNQSTITSSKLSPPKCVSPFVDITSKTPPPISSIDMSNVPPPKSYTAMVFSLVSFKPYANAAAVGSLTILNTSSPAISPASFVAFLCSSLKYAGTVITAWVTSSPK